MENLLQIIKKHDKIINNPKAPSTNPTCNCRSKEKCPLDGICTTPNVIYKASTAPDTNKVNIGLTDGHWKRRFNQRKVTLNQRKYEHSTTLSKFIWKMKDKTKTAPKISWSILKTAPAYNNIVYFASMKRCHLSPTQTKTSS